MPSINPSRYLKLSSSSGASDRALPVFSGVPIRNLLGSIWSGLRFREFGHRTSARKYLEIESGSETSPPRDQLILYLVRHAGTHVECAGRHVPAQVMSPRHPHKRLGVHPRIQCHFSVHFKSPNLARDLHLFDPQLLHHTLQKCGEMRWKTSFGVHQSSQGKLLV